VAVPMGEPGVIPPVLQHTACTKLACKSISHGSGYSHLAKGSAGRPMVSQGGPHAPLALATQDPTSRAQDPGPRTKDPTSNTQRPTPNTEHPPVALVALLRCRC
jgi:hypothetical protein